MPDTVTKPDFGPFNYVRELQRRMDESGWWHSFELPNGQVIKGSCDLPGLQRRIQQFPIPNDLRGKRVLDIGAWDGWFSFEMERRGAEVLAIDVFDNPRFHQIHEILNSRVEYQQMDVYDLDPRRIGQFDIVLFMGVLYHLKHPILALERVCSVTRGMAAVDSFALRDSDRPQTDLRNRPIMEFYETDEFGGQTDNWIAPSVPCLMALCRTAGFARSELRSQMEYSTCIACYREWEAVSKTKGTAPRLLNAFHHMNFGINFYSSKDDYITSWFDVFGQEVSLDKLKPQVDSFGVRPLHFSKVEGHWQATFKCPPGLSPGWHDVTLAIGDSPGSNPVKIAVDLKPDTDSLRIASICDGTTWKPGEINLDLGDSLSMWIEGLPENADRNNVQVIVSGVKAPVAYVEPPKTEGRQLNASLPAGKWSDATLKVSVKVGATTSQTVPVRIVSG